MKIQGTWIIPHRNIVKPPHQTGWKWTRTAKPTQRNKKISKKMLHKYGKTQILIARLHFSMVVLWGQLHKDFLRFANWTSSSGRRGNFYQVARGQHPLLCALSTTDQEPQLSKQYRVDRWWPYILGSTIFKLFKSRRLPGCTAAGRIP